jgi:hypothetical protein
LQRTFLSLCFSLPLVVDGKMGDMHWNVALAPKRDSSFASGFWIELSNAKHGADEGIEPKSIHANHASSESVSRKRKGSGVRGIRLAEAKAQIDKAEWTWVFEEDLLAEGFGGPVHWLLNKKA